jgi:hypothetical protein
MVMPLYEGNTMFSEASNASMAEADGIEEEIIVPEVTKLSVCSYFSQEKPFLVSLPDFTQYFSPELSRKIFNFLHASDLAISRRVSKKWKDIIDGGVDWK